MNNRPSHLYGESIFTTTKTMDGKVIFRTQHLERLLAQTSEYYLLGRVSVKALADHFEVESKLEDFARKYPNHVLRLTFFGNERDVLIPKSFAITDLNFEISSRELSLKSEVSLKLMPSPYSSFKSSIKAGSYFQNFYFKRQAMSEGFDDVLFHLDQKLCEASTSNIIFGKDGVLFTPEDPSIFYGLGLEVLKASGLQAEKIIIKNSELKTFNECYLVNSVNFLTPVARIDDHFFTNSEHESRVAVVDSFLRSHL